MEFHTNSRPHEIVAAMITSRLEEAPQQRIMLPTGKTPQPLYRHLITRPNLFRHATLLQLDEYLGTTQYQQELLQQFDGMFAKTEFINTTSDHLDVVISEYQAVVDTGIDLVVLGLGRNGHVGFNEPGSAPDSHVRLVNLHPATIEDAGGNIPMQAVTVGLGDLAQAGEIIMLVTGEAKAAALHELLLGIGVASPLLEHPRISIIADDAAAGQLPQNRVG